MLDSKKRPRVLATRQPKRSKAPGTRAATKPGSMERMLQKVETLRIKPVKVDFKGAVFRVRAFRQGVQQYLGVLEYLDNSFAVVTSKKPRSSKVSTEALSIKDIEYMAGSTVGKPTCITVRCEQLVQDVVGKIDSSDDLLHIKCEGGAVLSLNTGLLRLSVTKL